MKKLILFTYYMGYTRQPIIICEVDGDFISIMPSDCRNAFVINEVDYFPLGCNERTTEDDIRVLLYDAIDTWCNTNNIENAVNMNGKYIATFIEKVLQYKR